MLDPLNCISCFSERRGVGICQTLHIVFHAFSERRGYSFMLDLDYYIIKFWWEGRCRHMPDPPHYFSSFVGGK
jgi:hypothetical protein